MREGGLGVLPGRSTGGFKNRRFLACVASLSFLIDFPSNFGRFFVDFETQIHRKTCTKIYTIWGALFHSKIVDDGEAQTLKILVLPRKNHGF